MMLTIGGLSPSRGRGGARRALNALYRGQAWRGLPSLRAEIRLGFSFLSRDSSPNQPTYLTMVFPPHERSKETRRRLPHLYPQGKLLFLTWHLYGSIPHTLYLRGTMQRRGESSAAQRERRLGLRLDGQVPRYGA